jgi:hypothetical protein
MPRNPSLVRFSYNFFGAHPELSVQWFDKHIS